MHKSIGQVHKLGCYTVDIGLYSTFSLFF